MPSGRDWLDLIRSTLSSVGREDLSGLYSLDWPHAKAKLVGGEDEAIVKTSGRFKRFLRTTNAVLFGLSRRLAPARRILFGAALACVLLSFNADLEFRREQIEGGVRRVSEWGFYFGNLLLLAALVLMGLLLAMELVDKINYRDELELARDLQASLLPTELPRTPGFELAAHNEIANLVGGDVYDFVELPRGRLAVLFGDASGHGMTAGLVMAVAHAAFRTQLDMDAAPGPMFAAMNRILCRTGTPRAFFGAVYLLLEPDGAYAASVAGHPPVLRVGRDGSILGGIGQGAYPLGIKPDLSWEIECGRLAAGELLLLCSDGVTEAHDRIGDVFSEERLAAALPRLASLSAADLVEGVAGDVRSFRANKTPEDDTSVAVIRFVG